MRIAFVTLSACLALWMPVSIAQPDHGSEGFLLVSITTVEGAWGDAIEGKTGFEFYLEHGSGSHGEILGYEFRGGELVDSVRDYGPGAVEFMKVFREISLEPFDWKSEKESAWRSLKAADGSMWVTTDGVKHRIEIQTVHGKFVMEDWNPLTEIFQLAPYSTNISKLKSAVDLVHGYYGRVKMGMP